MNVDSISFLDTVVALLPILIILVLMIGFRLSGAWAGAASWFIALVASILRFGAGLQLLLFSQLKGLFFTLFVLYIIWMAIALYYVLREAGAIAVIAEHVGRLTHDRTLQLLLMSWVFSAFLGGMSGFGVPIAVVAPILVSMGFSPLTSVVAVAAGHSWGVNFGDIGAPFNALVVTTSMPGDILAPWAAVTLGVACLACGFAAVYSYCGMESIRHAAFAILAVGAVMIGTQYLLVLSGLWNLGSLVAGMAGIVSILFIRRLPFYAAAARWLEVREPETGPASKKPIPFLLAMAPYTLLVAIILMVAFVPPIKQFLNQVQLSAALPALETSRGWLNPASRTVSISLFGHTGALLACTALISFILFQGAGFNGHGSVRHILSQTVRTAGLSSIGIAAMVGTAMIMDQSGMSFALAVGLSRLFRPVYPLLSPFIGLLGAFTTGSNLNSNVLFGGLQKETAQLLNLPVAVILAAQTTGGSLGSMVSPAKIILGCSTAGLSGKEGQVMRRTAVYAMVIAMLVGGVTWILTRV